MNLSAIWFRLLIIHFITRRYMFPGICMKHKTLIMKNLVKIHFSLNLKFSKILSERDGCQKFILTTKKKRWFDFKNNILFYNWTIE